jgi:altronate dehydratase large subunit
MENDAKEDKGTKASLSDLTIGVKCGASDATSGLASNPAVGNAVDKLIEESATVIFGETTEVLGAEHILAKRGVDKKVKDKIYEKVEQMENRAKAFGVDMRGGQPTKGNIRGGLTTIENKSLGAIVKGGTKPIQDVLGYGKSPPKPGLYFMDSPGREMEYLTGVVSAGAQIVLFTTGIGAPQGFPIAPVIKVTGNKHTYRKLEEYMDIDVSKIIEGEETFQL